MQMCLWQKDLFSVACYICACMKLHATLLEEWDPNQPSWGWMDVIYIFIYIYILSQPLALPSQPTTEAWFDPGHVANAVASPRMRARLGGGQARVGDVVQEHGRRRLQEHDADRVHIIA